MADQVTGPLSVEEPTTHGAHGAAIQMVNALDSHISPFGCQEAQEVRRPSAIRAVVVIYAMRSSG